MLVKVLAGMAAIGLALVYLLPMVVKMGDVALTSVVTIGVVFMLVDLWHSLRRPDD